MNILDLTGSFEWDLKNSYIIGDSYREIEAAKNLGCKSIAVECGRSEFGDSKPDYKVKDLYEAVKLILFDYYPVAVG